MKMTIESTDQITAIDGVKVRGWEGVTAGGVKCVVFVPAPIPVIADGIMWLAVVGNLQIALRHPANVGASSRMVVDFAKQLLLKLIEEGVLTDEEARVGFADFR